MLAWCAFGAIAGFQASLLASHLKKNDDDGNLYRFRSGLCLPALCITKTREILTVWVPNFSA
jgi:hypothetical protein